MRFESVAGMLRHLETDQCSKCPSSTTALLMVALDRAPAYTGWQVQGEYRRYRRLVCPDCNDFEFSVVSTMFDHVEKSDCFYSQFDKKRDGLWKLLRGIREKIRGQKREIYNCNV